MRTILGDRKVHGMWSYSDDELFGAVVSVFAVGLAPSPYALSPNNPVTAKEIQPELPTGREYGMVVYNAVRLMIGGEESGGSLVTRSMTVKDSGQRQKRLMSELARILYGYSAAGNPAEGGAGNGVLASFQSLAQFCGAWMGSSPLEVMTAGTAVTITDHVGGITI